MNGDIICRISRYIGTIRDCRDIKRQGRFSCYLAGMRRDYRVVRRSVIGKLPPIRCFIPS